MDHSSLCRVTITVVSLVVEFNTCYVVKHVELFILFDVIVLPLEQYVGSINPVQIPSEKFIFVDGY